MASNLSRLERLRNRRVDPQIRIGGLNEVYGKLTAQDSAIQYAIGAMQPIDPEYTKRTIDERTRVEQQLAECFATANREVTFDYQGSVTNDTHIKAHSDVDLLTVDGRSYAIQPPNPALYPYTGDPVQDLKELRKLSVAKLKSTYYAALVDESGGKAINISGGSLQRKIDVIACNWWHTTEYWNDRQKHLMGIQILDNDSNCRIANKPFLHNKRIEERDAAVNGGLRKLIRLLKSLKYDSDDEIKISSYDIASIVYNNFTDWLTARPGQDLVLVKKCHDYLGYLLYDVAARAAIEVPNKMRKVFGIDGATEEGLRQMWTALGVLIRDIEQGLARSFKKLEEARVPY